MKIDWYESFFGNYTGFGTVKYRIKPCRYRTCFACERGLDFTVFTDSFRLAIQKCQEYEDEISK